MTEIGIRDQAFSVELSFTGISRERAAKVVGECFDAPPQHLKGTYDTWTVEDREGKTWKLIHDPTVLGEWKMLNDYLPRNRSEFRVRLVTPSLEFGEIPKLQNCVRRLHEAGGIVNASCDMSVQVDASNHNRQSLKNLIGTMYSKEDILFRALRVNEARAAVYSKKVREPLVQQVRALSSDETKDLTELEVIWYGDHVPSHGKLDLTSRYALNLHSVFFRNTIEWRCFHSTLQPAQAAACIHLCLAMSAQAISQRSTVMKKTQSENEQFTFRTWLVRLGLNGNEFKETRERLLRNLEGNKAWRHAKPATGKERRKKHRESAR